MEIELNIQQKKEFYSSLIEFLNTTETNEIRQLSDNIEKLEFLKNKEEMISTLYLLSKIANNHNRFPNFIDKLGKIIQYLIQQIQTQVSDFEIYQIFKNNKRFLLLLFDQGFIQPDEEIISDIMSINDENNFPYSHYLYSGIKSFIDKNTLEMIENEIKTKYKEEITDFVEKCRIGENDSYICSLIRQDSVTEFISYINHKSISLTSEIQPSIYETNSFLLQKAPTLIEYASFYGSIQIVRYSKYSEASLPSSIWIYAIHSNNAEFVHFCEDNTIEPEKLGTYESNPIMMQPRFWNQQKASYNEIYAESIVCHHNDIANYIKDNFIDNDQMDNFGLCIANCYNYYYYPSDIGCLISKPRNPNGFINSQQFKSFTQITIPPSVTGIGNEVFKGCSSLTQITIPPSVTSIGDSAFYECSSLTQITIPSFVASIGDYAFYGCSSLTQITIPSFVTKIGEGAFAICTSLKEFTIPSSVTLIGESAFDGCSSLKQITIPSSVTEIRKGAFYRCSSLTQLTIPSSVTEIGDYAFAECTSLTQITIPSSITEFKEGIFNRCSSLKQIKIPYSVTKIGDYAFAECSSLTQITIPYSVTEIGICAFSECSSLEPVIIPPSVTRIGEGFSYFCFKS